ncbi:MAG: ABC-type transport auxiliary lipoprotein family protein [Paracoccus sp. (in: a-proteobacteria)]|uniref:ABC-type transport auxiliary lipoprotein family protein n=1 Tax=Paracoccus sp. TaxID=267 RepID=UPI0026DF5A69|nr:ABC-type transport auxiliary lipoprotein family protein [Paracoccus sp. (in: a-proteobacteria)]MDO5630708.1 ABC-type transport auxiliary lipoprotein family protein [Paracoccus sp. (in: a-proteobacteria)]
MKPLFAALIALMTIPGCGALSALQGEPARDVFDLRPPVDGPRQCSARNRVELVIEEPKSGGDLNTERIMIRPNPLQVQYLPDARWSDTVPTMVQTLLVRTLGAYDVFSHVGRAPLGMSGDVALLTEISDFNAVTGDGGTRILMRIDAQLVQEMGATVIARRQFRADVPVTSTTTAQLIPAFDAASQQVLSEISAWAVGAVGRGATCR